MNGQVSGQVGGQVGGYVRGLVGIAKALHRAWLGGSRAGAYPLPPARPDGQPRPGVAA